ncbi:MAG TPA: glycoside hydrolase [Elusimicrobia bacterium]|nr:glycoside hydrolase [Elusimicrobiota bacterium]
MAAVLKATAAPAASAPQREELRPAPFPQGVLAYLRSISGKGTVAGQHNREPNAEPAKWTEKVFEATGKYPGLWSGDFLFQAENIADRWKVIYEAERQWKKGAIVQLMWHSCSPYLAEPCGWDKNGVLSHIPDDQWKLLVTDGTELNLKWKKRMDEIAVYLKYLQDKKVEVLFRPLHEMNQGLFWWGGRPGPDGTRRIYQLTHDYFTKTKGLTNLVWVWDMQDMSRDFEKYDPGDKYWDIMAFDIYEGGYDKKWYKYVLSVAGDKPVAIGECAKLPSPQLFKEQPRWVFFMAWAELAFEKNTPQQLKDLYNAPGVLTLDELKR